MAKKKQIKKDPYDPLEEGEGWLNRSWRPAAAVVYLAICVFDFIVAPAFMGFKSANMAQMAAAIKDLDPQIAVALIQNRTPWQPLTMQGSGLFHVAFGAILGVAAWTRGSAQIESIRQSGESDRSPYTPTMVPTYYVPSQLNPNPTPVTQVNVTGGNNPAVDQTTAAGIDNPDAEPDKY
jgi:hypothetical protein